MKGYFKNPDATAKALRDGWLYTGDLAYLDADGFLVVVGREKALLIAEDGEKYSPEEIEEAVTFSTDVIDQIMAWCDQKKYTIALVTLDTGKVERMVKARASPRPRLSSPSLQEDFYRFKNDPKAKKVQALDPVGVPDRARAVQREGRHRELHDEARAPPRGGAAPRPDRLLLHVRGVEDREPAQPRGAARDVQARVSPARGTAAAAAAARVRAGGARTRVDPFAVQVGHDQPRAQHRLVESAAPSPPDRGR